MRYDIFDTSHSHSLYVEIQDVSAPLLDVPIPLTNRKDAIWHLWTEEFWTPGSLPLKVAITLGAKSGLQVWSADTRLLDISPFDAGTRVKLLLPTEEILWVSTR